MKQCSLVALVLLTIVPATELLPAAVSAQAPTVLAVWGAGQFWHPEGVAVDSVGNVYIANGAFRSIDIWSHEGAPISRFGGEGTLYYPARVAFGVDGLVYVADAATGGTPVYKSEISVWRDGLLLQRIGTWGWSAPRS